MRKSTNKMIPNVVSLKALWLVLIWICGNGVKVQATEPLLFENVGTMVAGLSYIHTQIPVGLLPLMERLNRYEEYLKKNFSYDALLQRAILYAPTHSMEHAQPTINQWAQVAQSHISQVKTLKQTVEALYYSLPKIAQNPNHRLQRMFKSDLSPIDDVAPLRAFQDQMGNTFGPFNESESSIREKRALPLLAVGALAIGSILGTFLGIYSTSQINQLWAEMDKTKEAINRLVTITENHDHLLKSLDHKLHSLSDQIFLMQLFNPGTLNHRLQLIFTQLQEQTHKIVHTIQQAQHRRLAIDFLSHAEIKTLYQTLDYTAKKYGCSLITTHHSDLFQLETSYAFDGEIVTLILHTPIAPKDSFLRLFKLHPFPVPFSNDSLLIPDVKNDILGISNTNERLSIQFPSTELLPCLKVNSFFLCPKANALARRFENSCLGSLYTQNFPSARALCQFRIEPLREFAYSLLQNWFLIFSPHHKLLPFSCINGTTGEYHLKKGITKFHLSAGCTGELDQYRLVSDLSILIPTDLLQIDMDWESFNILPAEKELLLPQLKRLRDLGANSFTFSEIRSLLAAELAHPSYLHYIHYAFNGVAGITLFFLLFMFIQRCRRNFIQRKTERQATKLAQQSAAVLNQLRPTPIENESYQASNVHPSQLNPTLNNRKSVQFP